MAAIETAQLVCRTRGCDRENRVTAVHADTVLPVLCGGCSGVLLCVHDPERVTTRGGTLGAPFETVASVCRSCGVTLMSERHDLPPVDLKSLPVSVLEMVSGVGPGV